MGRPNTKRVKQELFLKCGRVDMYNMQKYKEKDLILHHEPPYRQTKHTIYEESYILSEETHLELHKIEHNDIKWITPAEISDYDFCPADEEILMRIKSEA